MSKSLKSFGGTLAEVAEVYPPIPPRRTARPLGAGAARIYAREAAAAAPSQPTAAAVSNPQEDTPEVRRVAALDQLADVIRNAATCEKVRWKDLPGLTWHQLHGQAASMLAAAGWNQRKAWNEAPALLDEARQIVRDEMRACAATRQKAAHYGT